ncbi:MAG: hypothetical protein AAGF11_54655, partial [Myxococcota bacterium]
MITRPSKGSPDYEIQVGYSLAVGQPVRRDDRVSCTQCSATELLTAVRNASESLANKLGERHEDETQNTEAEPESSNEGGPLADPPGEESPNFEELPPAKGDGIIMGTSGLALSVLGGGGVVGGAIAIGL